MTNEELMRRAIRLAEKSVAEGGGPFGAVIARDGELIAEASNHVVPHCDPTAHAEVSCIREACSRLGTFNLEGCDTYTSCEPCPTCLGALYCAHLDRIFYANNGKDAAAIGFDDDLIYQELYLPVEKRHKQMLLLLPEEAKKAFEMWAEKSDKDAY